MKKIILPALILLTIAMLALATPARAWEELTTPDLPHNFMDGAKWPKIHTEQCSPSGKRYVSIAHARITGEHKVEYVLITSVNENIFRYRHDMGGEAQPDFGYAYLQDKKNWLKFNNMDLSDNNAYNDLLEKKFLEMGISPAEFRSACGKLMTQFDKFWTDLLQEAGTYR